jgi:glycosyltransferase involved in cell wall biosynthesis
MKKILVFGMTENPGGVESFLMNYYRNFDVQQIQLDFLCNSYKPIAYEDEIHERGGKTFHFTARSKNPYLYKKELSAFFQQHSNEYEAIWVNVSSLANIDYLKLAKKYGIKRRIIHSHNSQNMDSRLRGLLHAYNKKHIDHYATDFWACSEAAARWFYEDRLMPRVKIIHNSIEIEKFAYSAEKRNGIRRQLGVEEDCLLLGNIGRLHHQKNQSFILDIASELKNQSVNFKVIFVGEGEDEEKLREKTRSLGLNNFIVFAGLQHDIQAWLSAFDIFLFPSLFEGLSVAALEAQANGVTVLASKGTIPTELKLTDNYYFYDLGHSADEWAQQIVSLPVARCAEGKIQQAFKEKRFDIKYTVNDLQKMLLGE